MSAPNRKRAAATRTTPTRHSVDLSAFPDLVAIHLGMRVARWRGVPTLFATGRRLRALLRSAPDGLLGHEDMLFRLRHIGFRPYWRDWDSLDRFAPARAPHGPFASAAGRLARAATTGSG